MNREEAIEVIRRSGLSAHPELLSKKLLPSARIIVQDETMNGVSDSAISQFGGVPLLPPVVNWPRWELSSGPVPLAFLAQLSLAEIHATAPVTGWPQAGTLAFFYDSSQPWGFDPKMRGHCRVLFFPVNEELLPAAIPVNLPADAKFPKRRVCFRHEWTLPECVEVDGAWLTIWENDEFRSLIKMLTQSDPCEGGPIHRCGGHEQELQGDMRLECQLVTNGLYCGDGSGYKDPRRFTLEQGASDWQLLAQFDSDEKQLRWMWGDAGRVYFWARRQDIEAANFDGAWAILQCY